MRINESERRSRERTRQELGKIPADQRKKMSVTDLHCWYFHAIKEGKIYPVKSDGDHWQAAHALLLDLIGDRAW